MQVICVSVWGNRAYWEGEIELLLGVFKVSKSMSLYVTAKG